MKINLTELMEEQKKVLELHLVYEMESIRYLGDDIKFISPISFNGKVYHLNQDIYIEGTIEGIAELTCYRCLKKFHKNIIGTIHEKLIKKESLPVADGEDDLVIKNNTIDIATVIENTLILSLPMKIICNDQCKGLCPVCGINRNDHTCHCKQDETHPEFAKLKALLQED